MSVPGPIDLPTSVVGDLSRRWVNRLGAQPLRRHWLSKAVEWRITRLRDRSATPLPAGVAALRVSRQHVAGMEAGVDLQGRGTDGTAERYLP
jgi:hypothetical protein